MEAIKTRLRSRRGSELGGRKLSSTHASNDSILSAEIDGPFDSKRVADDMKKRHTNQDSLVHLFIVLW